MQVSDKLSIPPSIELWGEVEADQDLMSVKEIFLGRTNVEIAPLLAKAYIVHCMDLAIMPDAVFDYYSLGFANFILNEVQDDERFGVFFGALLDSMFAKGRNSPQFIRDFWRKFNPMLERLLDKLVTAQMNQDTKGELLDEIAKISRS